MHIQLTLVVDTEVLYELEGGRVGDDEVPSCRLAGAGGTTCGLCLRLAPSVRMQANIKEGALVKCLLQGGE